jgi:nicotinate phosphoribosyltransferase
VDDANAALLTDLYELTMAASYFAHGMNGEATFELYVRELPPQRSFLVAAGLEDALHYLEQLHFDDDAISYLRTLGLFNEAFLRFLGELRFGGEAWAIAEGEVVFGEEPLLRITGPLIGAQIVETFLLNTIGFQTLIASKAARIAIACDGRDFVDFAPRRAHGTDAAMKGARASYIAGAAATSNVLAGRAYGIPLSGTMAHSYVMSFESELEAFRAYAGDFPTRATLLIDTYDTIHGAHNAVTIAKELAADGSALYGVRLDSGDLAVLASEVRAILDDGGCAGTRIFASGDLDEYRISELLTAGAPIDAFGVGTRLGTSADAPSLPIVYKLVEDGHGPKRKLSPAKATWPGRKQVHRFSKDGRYDHDVVTLADEVVRGGRPLLERVMAHGQRLAPPEPLAAIRARCTTSLAALPRHLRALSADGARYPVTRSDGVERAARLLDDAGG